MNQKGFDFRYSSDYKVFLFIDSGKKGDFETAIAYSPLEDNPDTFNLALVAKNSKTDQWDDQFYTENDNAVKVFRTVAATLELFYESYPQAKISFTGSDKVRTQIYTKILSARFKAISEFYIIEAARIDNETVIIPYNPEEADSYSRFILTKKIFLIQLAL